MKFGWKPFILWVISYRLSFLGFAINLSSCLETLEIGQITKMTVHKKCLLNKRFSTKFDELGVIIMRNRCSIQQGEENNCWLEQSPEKSTVSTVPLFLGHPVYQKVSDENLLACLVNWMYVYGNIPCMHVQTYLTNSSLRLHVYPLSSNLPTLISPPTSKS